jgi:hypothetical protein
MMKALTGSRSLVITLGSVRSFMSQGVFLSEDKVWCSAGFKKASVDLKQANVTAMSPTRKV